MAPSNGLMADASLFHQMYPSQHSSSGECGVDVIYTTLVSDVQLTYSPDGLRLCLLGFASFRRSGEIGLRYELVVYCWDTRSRRRLNETRLGEYVMLDSPLSIMYINNSPCIVLSLRPSYPGRVFTFYSFDGSIIGRFSTDGLAFHVVTNTGVLFLKNDKYFQKWDAQKRAWLPERERRILEIEDGGQESYLWKWNGKVSEPEYCGVISWKGVAPIYGVKAISETKDGLALILDDERLLHFTPEPAV